MTERTPEEIRGLEERLAREVMGWERVRNPIDIEPDTFFLHPRGGVEVSALQNRIKRWSPYTDANDALEVLEATEQEWAIHRFDSSVSKALRWAAVRMGEEADLSAWHSDSTLPAAICEAVLAWLEAGRDS